MTYVCDSAATRPFSQNTLGRLVTHPHYFVLSQSIAHRLCGINVVPHSDSKWNGIGSSAAQIWRPKRC